MTYRVLGLASALCFGGTGCGLIDSNLLDVPVHLQTQVYQNDFGTPGTSKVPTISCTQVNACSTIDSQAMNAQVTGQCDGTSCYAELGLTLTYTVNLSMDAAFQSSLNQKLIQAVRSIDLAYGMPVNTLNFDIPELEVYVGPQNAQAKTDPGVVLIDKTGLIAKGIPFADGSQHLTVADGTPARAQIAADIMQPKVPFVFLLSTSSTNPPKVKAGDPLPGGALKLDISPTITVGIPR